MVDNWVQKLYPDKCQTRIYYSRGLAWTQCSKKVKVEVGGKKYCAIHDPEAVKKRRDKLEEKHEKRMQYEKEMAIVNAIELLESNKEIGGEKKINDNERKIVDGISNIGAIIDKNNEKALRQERERIIKIIEEMIDERGWGEYNWEIGQVKKDILSAISKISDTK